MLTALLAVMYVIRLNGRSGAEGARRSGHQHAPTCFGRLLDGTTGPMMCDRSILTFSGSGVLALT
jgi:hypothetical protein